MQKKIFFGTSDTAITNQQNDLGSSFLQVNAIYRA